MRVGTGAWTMVVLSFLLACQASLQAQQAIPALPLTPARRLPEKPRVESQVSATPLADQLKRHPPKPSNVVDPLRLFMIDLVDGRRDTRRR